MSKNWSNLHIHRVSLVLWRYSNTDVSIFECLRSKMTSKCLSHWFCVSVFDSNINKIRKCITSLLRWHTNPLGYPQYTWMGCCFTIFWKVMLCQLHVISTPHTVLTIKSMLIVINSSFRASHTHNVGKYLTFQLRRQQISRENYYGNHCHLNIYAAAKSSCNEFYSHLWNIMNVNNNNRKIKFRNRLTNYGNLTRFH